MNQFQIAARDALTQALNEAFAKKSKSVTLDVPFAIAIGSALNAYEALGVEPSDPGRPVPPHGSGP